MTNKKKHLLFITKHDPYALGGGAYATRAYLRAFSVIFEGQIDICIADSCEPFGSDIQHDYLHRVEKRPLIHRLLSFLTGDMHRYTSFVKQLLQKHKEKYAICVFDQNAVGGTLVNYVNKLGLKTITIHHNYEPEYYKANEKNNIVKCLLLPQIKRVEKRSYKNSCMNLFLTTDDLNMFELIYGKPKGLNKMIGCFEYADYQIRNKNNSANEKPVFVITGSLNCFETKEALQFFFSELYEEIPSDSQIIIAGRNPDKEIEEWCQSYTNVQLIPNPKEMYEIINKADIYLSTNRLGGGLKLRLMDGISNGLPVLAHRTSARGYEAFMEIEALYTFKDKISFKSSIEKMLTRHQKGLFSKDQIQATYKKSFSFEAGVKRLQDILIESDC